MTHPDLYLDSTLQISTAYGKLATLHLSYYKAYGMMFLKCSKFHSLIRVVQKHVLPTLDTYYNNYILYHDINWAENLRPVFIYIKQQSHIFGNM